MTVIVTEIKAPVNKEIPVSSEIVELLQSELAFIGGGIGETAV